MILILLIIIKIKIFIIQIILIIIKIIIFIIQIIIFLILIITINLPKFKWVRLQHQAQELWASLKCRIQKY
jgi:hypothetical protein